MGRKRVYGNIDIDFVFEDDNDRISSEKTIRFFLENAIAVMNKQLPIKNCDTVFPVSLKKLIIDEWK